MELVALSHDRDGDRITIRGVVRNPREGANVDQLTAVAYLFDREGGFAWKWRAAIDVPALAPGAESAFVVTVDHAANVGRYRVSFKTGERVVPHVDRRNPWTLLSLRGTAAVVASPEIQAMTHSTRHPLLLLAALVAVAGRDAPGPAGAAARAAPSDDDVPIPQRRRVDQRDHHGVRRQRPIRLGPAARSDFLVFEDDRPVEVTHFSAERVPVSLGIALDTSGSMAGDKIREAEAALNRFTFELLDKDDEMFLYRFSNYPTLLQGWTTDRQLISRALGRLTPNGGTALVRRRRRSRARSRRAGGSRRRPSSSFPMATTPRAAPKSAT